MNDSGTPASAPGQGRGLRHILFPFEGEDRFLAGALSFVEGALGADEAVVVAVSDPHEELIRQALADTGTADRVSFLDTAELSRNPGRLIPVWQAWIEKASREGRPVRAISENPWAGRTSAESTELRYQEWLLNRAFADAPIWWLLCPFDTVADAAGTTLAALERTHPLVLRDAGPTTGSAYTDEPYAFEPLTDPCDPDEALAFTAGQLASVRDRITVCAGRHALAGDRLRDLLLAATEVAANSIKYAGGGTLRTWAEETRFVCEFRDSGHIADPMAGLVRPTVGQVGGRGLWLAQQMCDLVQIRSSAENGTTVRLAMEGVNGG
ncbi:sensor histidine kinase [Kitasatospora sp. NPDC085895]|uniref:sensor histidine kinase n=1 Tax=Kitasatospora sp. NPDC085895 TaxID=3155057 RepID=UPI00344E2AB6